MTGFVTGHIFVIVDILSKHYDSSEKTHLYFYLACIYSLRYSGISASTV